MSWAISTRHVLVIDAVLLASSHADWIKSISSARGFFRNAEQSMPPVEVKQLTVMAGGGDDDGFGDGGGGGDDRDRGVVTGARDRRDQKTCAVDTHRNPLAAAKTFGAWCVKQDWIATNPVANVAPIGQRNRGKKQLRIDEARKLGADAAADGLPRPHPESEVRFGNA